MSNTLQEFDQKLHRLEEENIDLKFEIRRLKKEASDKLDADLKLAQKGLGQMTGAVIKHAEKIGDEERDAKV